MRRDTTLIDHESAIKLLAAIDEVGPEIIVTALSNAVKRKLGQIPAALSDDNSYATRFERFFDIIFDVAPEEKPLPLDKVIELVDIVISRMDDWEDREDRADYEHFRKLLSENRVHEAMKLFRSFDTYNRERLFGRTDEEEFQLSVFFTENPT